MACRFAVTYDYRCPFARNAHEHIACALRGGAPWEVEFVPFSLTQAHVDEGGTPVWEDPARAAELICVEAGLVVMAREPDHFLDVHLGMFSARHDHGRDLRDEAVVRNVLEDHGVDPGIVFEAIAEGWPKESFRKSHEAVVTDHSVFGVPTFITGDDAVFARIMTRPDDDPKTSTATIETVLGLMRDNPELNEVKHTTIPH